MGMTLGCRVDIDMDDRGNPAEVRGGEAGLFQYLPQRRVFGPFAFIDVSAGLNPDAEPLVFMKDDTAPAHHDRRGRYVDRATVFGEGTIEPIKLFDEGDQRHPFLFIDRLMLGQESTKSFPLRLAGTHLGSVAMAAA